MKSQFFITAAFRLTDPDKEAGQEGEPDFTSSALDPEEQKIVAAKTAMTVWVGSQRGG